MTSLLELLLKPNDEKSTHTEPIQLKDRSGRYRLGPAQRPSIRHDNGHLDRFKKREPTLADRAALLTWVAKLNASERLCNQRTGPSIDACKGDLSDANAAYRHFLYGNGVDRVIDYEKYLREDPAASDLLKRVAEDFMLHAEIIGRDRLRFSLNSDAYTVGNGGIAPYPATTNWQKAIGAHYLWVSADVRVSADTSGSVWFRADMVVHVEDRYNFNPGATDIATGIPDSENGAFELTGLAHQYTNFAEVRRACRWKFGDPASLVISTTAQPSGPTKTSPPTTGGRN